MPFCLYYLERINDGEVNARLGCLRKIRSFFDIMIKVNFSLLLSDKSSYVTTKSAIKNTDYYADKLDEYRFLNSTFISYMISSNPFRVVENIILLHKNTLQQVFSG